MVDDFLWLEPLAGGILPVTSMFLASKKTVISTFVLGCLEPGSRSKAYLRIVDVLLERVNHIHTVNLQIKHSDASSQVEGLINCSLCPFASPPAGFSVVTSFAEIVADQEALYGRLDQQDKMKLVFQAVFGGAHFLSDISASRDYLIKEWNEVESYSTEPLAERISPEGDLYRINLRPAKELGLCLNDLFISIQDSARIVSGDLQRRKVKLLPQARSIGIEPDSITREPFHHSQDYKIKVKPAYRLIHREKLAYLLRGHELTTSQ